MIVRELITKLGFVTDEKKVKAFDARVASLKTALFRLAKVTAVVGGAFAAVAFKTASAGDEIAKTSRRLGISTKALQEWRFAADRAGVGAATFDMAFQRFGRRVAEAAKGQGEAKDALAEMGIELTDASGKLRDAETIFEESLIVLSKQEDAFTRNRLAMKLFDSEGVRLVQLAAEGAEGMRDLRKRARELGIVISDEAVKAAEEFNDKWTDMKAVVLGLVYALGEELLPLLSDLLKGMTKWVVENRKLLILLGKVAGAIGLVTLVVTAAIVPVAALTATWAALNSQIFLVPLLIAVFIVSILVGVAAIALLAEDILAFTKGKDSVFGKFAQGVEDLKANLAKRFREGWGIIKADALAIWQSIIDRVSQMWQTFVDTRLSGILKTFETIQKVIGVVSPSAGIGGYAAGLVTERAMAGGGSTSMEINVNVAPPVGTSATGVGQAVVTAFKASVNQLTMGRTGLGP